MPRPPNTKTDALRKAWAATKPGPNGCCNCSLNPNRRYPQVSMGGKAHRVHRLIFEEVYGDIPPGKFVLHLCASNKRCIRPEHLYLGTDSDNLRDAYEREGRPVFRPRGERHGMAKLTERDVLAIRDLHRRGWSIRELAEGFNVGKTTVAQVLHRITWSHVR